MDRVYELTLLLDFYGQLLTARQFEILDLHYNNDYSLGEIAQQLNISRQGVFDNIKRAKTTLDNLEEKLGLVKKFTGQKKKAEDILKNINRIDLDYLKAEDRKHLESIRQGIQEIIDG
ncbi:MAG: YlxM family DNA-binding protein [Clostridia bacterium]|nr:YlxM family DNA-binding protein [Clostridia bacterium]